MAIDSIRACTVCLLLVLTGCRTLDSTRGPSSPELGDEDLRLAEALAHYGQGLLYEGELGHASEEARRHFESAAALDPDAHRLSVRSALIAIKQSLPDKAISSLQQSCEANPDSLQAWVDLAVTCQIVGRFALAEESYRKALRIEPRRISVYVTLARLLFRQEKDAEALQVLNRGVRLVQNPAPLIGCCYQHGAALIRKSKPARALPCIEFVARHAQGQRHHLYHLLGEVYLELQNERKAVKNFKKAIKEDPPSVNAYRRLARIYMAKDVSRAIDLLREADQRLPENIALLLDLEYAYRRDQALEQAVAVLTKVNAIFEKAEGRKIKPEFFLHYGSVCERAGRFEQAEEIFEKCVDLYPEAHQALNYLAYMWAERGMNLDKAMEYVKRALKQEPENGAYIDTLGWIYFKQGKHSLARVEIQKALAFMKDDPTITDHLGDAFAALGDVDHAVRYWKRSFMIDPTKEAVAKKLKSHGVDLDQLREEAREPRETKN